MIPSKPVDAGTPRVTRDTVDASVTSPLGTNTSAQPVRGNPAFSTQKFSQFRSTGPSATRSITARAGAIETLEVCGIKDTAVGLLGRIEEHEPSRDLLNQALA